MKPKITGRALLTIASTLLSLLLLAGCALSKRDQFKQDMMVQGVQPISGKQLKTLMSNATQHEKHPTKYEATFHYSADGTADGKAVGSFGEKIYIGTWRINDQGALCQEWNGRENCYLYYPKKRDSEFTRVQLTGPQSTFWPDGLTPVTITPGM